MFAPKNSAVRAMLAGLGVTMEQLGEDLELLNEVILSEWVFMPGRTQNREAAVRW